MVSKVVFLWIAILCGLSITADAMIAINLKEKAGNPGFYNYVISCTAGDVDITAKEIQIIQILKEEPGQQTGSVAQIFENLSEIVWGGTEGASFEGFGNIDTQDRENSFLFLTLINPTVKDEADYVCDIYYEDATGLQQHTSSKATLELPKRVLHVEKDSKDLKNLQNQIDAINSVNLKNIQDQINALKSTTLKKLQGQIDAFKSTSLKSLEDQIHALKSSNTKIVTDQYDALNKIKKQVNDLESKNSEKQDRITQLESKLESQEKKFLEKIREQVNIRNLLVTRYNNQFNQAFNLIRKQGTDVTKSMSDQKNSLNEMLEDSVAKLNETIVALKDGLEEGQRLELKTLTSDLQEYVETFENFTKELANRDFTKEFAKKESVSDLENRVTNAEIVSTRLADQISKVTDEVSILQYLVDGSATEAIDKPKRGSMAQLAPQIDTLDKRTDDQTQEILNLKKELTGKSLTRNNITAFSAMLTRAIAVNSGDIIVFDKVMLNKGQGYDGATGVFTAPRSGLFAFTLVVVTQINKDRIDLDIRVNQDTVAKLVANEKTRDDQTTVTAVTLLQAGDKVRVYVDYTDSGRTNRLAALHSTVFSGYFINSL